MNQGIKTVIYPVKDMARAKTLFRNLLGAEPIVDQPFYVGFQIGDQHIGLDPNGHKAGATVYYHVDDIRKSLQSVVDSDAKVLQEVKDVGGGKLVALAKDAEGNLIGLIQSPAEKSS